MCHQGFQAGILGQKTAFGTDFRPEASDLGLHSRARAVILATGGPVVEPGKSHLGNVGFSKVLAVTGAGGKTSLLWQALEPYA